MSFGGTVRMSLIIRAYSLALPIQVPEACHGYISCTKNRQKFDRPIPRFSSGYRSAGGEFIFVHY